MIFRRLKDSNGERVNWFKIRWMRFLRSVLYKMFHETSMNEYASFNLLLLGRGRPRNFNNVESTPLYKNVRPIATLKYNDIMTCYTMYHLYTIIILNPSRIRKLGEEWIINYEILFERNISLTVNKSWILFNFITQNCYNTFIQFYNTFFLF